MTRGSHDGTAAHRPEPHRSSERANASVMLTVRRPLRELVRELVWDP